MQRSADNYTPPGIEVCELHEVEIAPCAESGLPYAIVLEVTQGISTGLVHSIWTRYKEEPAKC